jgi:glutamate racemase
VGTGTPIFIIDTCIGGLSVVKSLWGSGCAPDALFMADYAVNPLGVKNDNEIAGVVRRWLAMGEHHADTAVIACNTLSVHYHRMPASSRPSGPERIVSMVDCFESMVKHETDRLAGSKTLIVGTAFTAAQAVYSDLLRDAVPGVQVDTAAATALERSIARFEARDVGSLPALDDGLCQAIESADVVVLACTCFPLIRAELESLFPHVIFLDPGAYAADLLGSRDRFSSGRLRVEVTGDAVEPARVSEFAASYLRDYGVVY